MARPTLFLALCIVASIAVAVVRGARHLPEPLLVEGRVYCDTCRAGFVTPSSTYIAGAKVRIECKRRDSLRITYSNEAHTDATGTYRILVNEDHGDQICEVVLVSSPRSDCALIVPGVDRARAMLTTHNGIASTKRHVNSLAFVREEPVSGCAAILQAYDEANSDD